MNSKIFATIYIILLITSTSLFLYFSEDKYCYTYEGSFYNNTNLYIRNGYENNIKTEECFNNSLDRQKRKEEIEKIIYESHKGSYGNIRYDISQQKPIGVN